MESNKYEIFTKTLYLGIGFLMFHLCYDNVAEDSPAGCYVWPNLREGEQFRNFDFYAGLAYTIATICLRYGEEARMDPVTIATGVVAFLSPFLVEGGKAMAKKAGEALVTALERRFKDRPAAQEALGDVKQEPRNEDFQAVLRVQLQKALAADGEFLAEVARLLKEAQADAGTAGYHAEVHGSGAIAQGPGAVAAGAGSVVVGGSLRDSTVITGDGNVVGDHSRSSVRSGEKGSKRR